MAISIPIVSEFDGTGVKKAVQQFKQLEGAGAKAQFALKKAAIPAAAALAGLTAGLVDATKGAIEDEAAQKALAGQLKRTTGATDSQIASVEDWITAQGKAFGIADDKLRPALSKLATASKDVTRAQQLARTAMDISAASGKDYETVVAALTKAELGQYASLKKLGVPIGDNTRALMDMAAETKKVHKAQTDLDNAIARGDKKDIVKATEKLAEAQRRLNAVTVEGADYVTDLNKAFGGAATDAANTAAGGFKRLALSLSETKESIGAALLPIVEALLPKLQGLASWAQDNPKKFVIVATVIGSIATAVMLMNGALAAYNLVAGITTAVNGALATSFTAVQVASGLIVFTALIAAIVALYVKFQWFRDGIKNVVKGIVFYFQTIANAYISMANLIIKGINLFKPGKDIPSIPSVNLVSFGDGEENVVGGESVPKMAAGGVVTAPTLALVGEAGPEAIVPLSKMGQMGGNVTIHVNGGDPNAVVAALRRYMQLNGSVPIRVS